MQLLLLNYQSGHIILSNYMLNLTKYYFHILRFNYFAVELRYEIRQQETCLKLFGVNKPHRKI